MTPTRTVRHNYTFSTQYASTTKGFLFNFADMNEAQVPWDAFIGGPNCELREQNLCNGKEKKIMPDQYHPELSLNKAAVKTADPAWSGCEIPHLSTNVQYVPITATVVTAPSQTRWGATVSVGPKTLRLEPSAGVQLRNAVRGQRCLVAVKEDGVIPSMVEFEEDDLYARSLWSGMDGMVDIGVGGAGFGTCGRGEEGGEGSVGGKGAED
jgi:hypothetical protein